MTAKAPKRVRCAVYTRVSTEDQELGLQITALRAAGVPEANINIAQEQARLAGRRQ